MPISQADAQQAREIKENVRAGRINGSYSAGQPGNPGFQVYANAGGFGTRILPAAARNETYYEYQLGTATAPAAGFGAGAGPAGMRRLVLLVSPVQRFDIRTFCHVPNVVPGGGGPAVPTAVALPISGDLQPLMLLRTNQTQGAGLVSPYVRAAGLAHTLLAPGVGEEFRTIERQLTGAPRNRYHLPVGNSNVTLYFVGSHRTTYLIHEAYYTDDHYVSFTKV